MTMTNVMVAAKATSKPRGSRDETRGPNSRPPRAQLLARPRRPPVAPPAWLPPRVAASDRAKPELRPSRAESPGRAARPIGAASSLPDAFRAPVSSAPQSWRVGSARWTSREYSCRRGLVPCSGIAKIPASGSVESKRPACGWRDASSKNLVQGAAWPWFWLACRVAID
jgi:hypothetical protein